MKIAFLDLEGVLITHRTILSVSSEYLQEEDKRIMYNGEGRKEHLTKFIDEVGWCLIAHMLKKHNAHAVISSTLRNNDEIPDILKDILIKRGLDATDIFPTDIPWRTQVGWSKYDAIDLYLGDYPVTKYAVIDDNPVRGHEHRMVPVNAFNGFGAVEYTECQKFLSDSPVVKIEAIFL